MIESQNNENVAENQSVVDVVKQIRRLILVSMDGVTAQKLRENSTANRQNLGVALPRLREIVAQFSPSTDVAQSLWRVGSRECKIVALGLVPNDADAIQVLTTWLPQIDTLELAEVAAMFLAQKCTDFELLITSLLQTENRFARVLLYNVCSRRVEQLTFAQISLLVDNVLTNTLAPFEASALLNLLLHVNDNKCVSSKEFNMLIDKLQHSNSELCQRLGNEVCAICGIDVK